VFLCAVARSDLTHMRRIPRVMILSINYSEAGLLCTVSLVVSRVYGLYFCAHVEGRTEPRFDRCSFLDFGELKK
jgi:hypothetical protein